MVNALLPNVKFAIGIKNLYKTIIFSCKNNKLNILLLLLANVVNISIFIVAYYFSVIFPTMFIGLLVTNVLILMSFYIYLENKINHKTPRLIYILIGVAVVVLSTSLVFFSIPTYIKYGTPADSRKYNKPCVMFSYFDTHDIWHFLSAIGIFILLRIALILQPKINELRLRLTDT